MQRGKNRLDSQAVRAETSDGRFAREENDLIQFSVKFDSIRYNQSAHILRSHDVCQRIFCLCPSFLPRCMKCRRGLAMRILSVRPSVCHTRDPWQNGKKIGPDFCTIRKIILPSLLRIRMVGGGRPLLPEILGQPARVRAKSPILNR